MNDPTAMASQPSRGPRWRPVAACAGGLAGGILGHFAFLWIVRQGFYGIILPGVLAGAACGALSGRRSVGLGVWCAALGIVLGVWSEWSFAPFIRDPGLGYFLTHLDHLRPMTMILIALGGALGYWFGIGREAGACARPSAEAAPTRPAAGPDDAP